MTETLVSHSSGTSKWSSASSGVQRRLPEEDFTISSDYRAGASGGSVVTVRQAAFRWWAAATQVLQGAGWSARAEVTTAGVPVGGHRTRCPGRAWQLPLHHEADGVGSFSPTMWRSRRWSAPASHYICGAGSSWIPWTFTTSTSHACRPPPCAMRVPPDERAPDARWIKRMVIIRRAYPDTI